MGYQHEHGPSLNRVDPTAKLSTAAHRLRRGAHRPATPQLGLLLLDRGDFQIRLANHHCSKESDQLVTRMYSWRGYRVNSDTTHHQDDEITLQACRDSSVFGTLTVRFDSEQGLAADALYQTELDMFRARGARVAELSRLAVDPELGSKEVLGALFHMAYVFCGRLRNIDDVFIEVNPRHVAFYRRMLNFTTAGPRKTCPRVDAPAVLMHVSVQYVGTQASLWGGQRAASARSLYPYFCSAAEETDIAQRALGAEPGRASPGASETYARAISGARRLASAA